MKKNYTIGLDIGTASVGWSVIDEKNQLIRKKMKINGDSEKTHVKKNFWGVRLFDEGKTAEDRRLKRTTRRRYTRRRNRILYLRDIFQSEVNNIDINFFNRLDESFFIPDDKQYTRYPIFGSLEEEKDYYEMYPTIFHLRKKLVDSDEKEDIRLIYLAIAHMVKYRGHFLIEGKLNTENSSIKETFKNFLKEYNQVFTQQSDGSFINPVDESVSAEDIFNEKFSRSKKAEKALLLFPGEKSTSTFSQFLKIIVGNQGNFKKTFSLEEDAKIQFSKDDYEEVIDNLLSVVGDEYADVFIAAKNAYDAIELSGILKSRDQKTRAKLSSSMLEKYEDHKKDLYDLKEFFRKYLPEFYHDMFKNEKKNGYAGYIEGETTQEEFYKYTRKLLNDFEEARYFIEKINHEDFLRKQRTFDNGVIPHQIHFEELKIILENQKRYYPFLIENEERIKEIFSFRIPYYVGPLAKGNSSFAWLVRKNGIAITPSNIDSVVDMNQSAIEFINKMTNVDSYLPNEKVLPKNSMLYQKYMVFNELTKIKYINDQGLKYNFSSVEKKQLFEKLFKVKRKVTKKDLESFLEKEYLIEAPTIEGIETAFNASFSTYHDLKKIGISKELLDNEEKEDMFEEIIKTLTIFEDRKMISKQLEPYQELFTPQIMKKLERRHYTGWGRLSEKLIDGIRDKESGKTILDFLVEDDGVPRNINRNLMQLINDGNLSFKDKITNEQTEKESKSIEDVVRSLMGSPAIKKGILQSLKIVEELVSIMGYPPTNIVVEMARENQTTEYGKSKSQARLKKLELAMKDIENNILKQHPTTNQALRDDRLYLYYLQNGKDMYTGKDLDINFLSQYDIDHIIPRSFTTDNSINNKVLVSSKDNRGKSDDVPSLKIVDKCESFWKVLLKSNLMSEQKFKNLTKIKTGGLKDLDKEKFIHRQLVETRQITKHVARILDEQFNINKDDNGKIIREVNIITLKSALVSQFRQNFNLYKVREINDYHHAHDAYLNAVVASTLLKVYPKLKPEFVYGEYYKGSPFKERTATAKKQYYSNIMHFFSSDKLITDSETGEILWDQKNMATVKQVLGYRQMNIVKKVEVQTGGFSKENLKKRGESDKLINKKNYLNSEKYGGYPSPNLAYTVLFKYKKGKKDETVHEFIGISIMKQKEFEKNYIKYLEELGYREPVVKNILPKYTLFEMENGRRRLLASATELQKGNQMVLPSHLNNLLYHALKASEGKHKSIEYVTEHKEQFEEIINQVKDFSDRYTLADTNLKRIMDLYFENENTEIEKISEAFINLMKLNKMGAPSDFIFFDTKIPRKRYSSTSELFKGKIIFQSVTGLYETYQKV